jgi:hypothetical protein
MSQDPNAPRDAVVRIDSPLAITDADWWKLLAQELGKSQGRSIPPVQSHVLGVVEGLLQQQGITLHDADRMKPSRLLQRLQTVGLLQLGFPDPEPTALIRGRLEEPRRTGIPSSLPLAPTPMDATAEEKVARYLENNLSPQLTDAASATGLSKHRIQKTKAWQAFEKRQLEAFLSSKPNAQMPDVRERFGWSNPKISGMDAWKRHRERREAQKTLPESKERQLDDRTLEGHPMPSREEAAEEAREYLWRGMLDEADPRTRGKLNGLADRDRERLLTYLVENLEPVKLKAAAEADRIQITLLAASGWLEEQEQERRRCSRPDPGR